MKILSIDEKWKCICGQLATKQDGYYRCLSIDPADAEWTKNCYACSRCGRVINQESLEIVGVRVD